LRVVASCTLSSPDEEYRASAGSIAGFYSRLMVEWLTLNDRPMSTNDSPASRRAMASWRWWFVSFGLRP
jgi:hypothetical protein